MIKCRINAAFNFPAMALLFAGVPRPNGNNNDDNKSAEPFSPTLQIGSQLLASLSTLCKDPRPEVRRRVAAGFHEIVASLKEIDAALETCPSSSTTSVSGGVITGKGPAAANFLENNKASLFDSLTYLLFDETLGVLKGLVRHLDATLSVLADRHLGRGTSAENWDENGEEDGEDVDHPLEGGGGGGVVNSNGRTQLRQMLFAGLVQCEETVYDSYDWRLQAEVFEKWARILPMWFSSDQIFFNVIPFMFDKIKDSRPLPGKEETTDGSNGAGASHNVFRILTLKRSFMGGKRLCNGDCRIAGCLNDD